MVGSICTPRRQYISGIYIYILPIGWLYVTYPPIKGTRKLTPLTSYIRIGFFFQRSAPRSSSSPNATRCFARYRRTEVLCGFGMSEWVDAREGDRMGEQGTLVVYESQHQHGAIDMTGGFKCFLFSPLFGEDVQFSYPECCNDLHWSAVVIWNWRLSCLGEKEWISARRLISTIAGLPLS